MTAAHVTARPNPVGSRSLVRLLARHLRPYRGQVAAIVVLQLLQTIALLYLPTLNADIIDNGVVRGDTRHIMRVGLLMIAITLLQCAATVCAVFLSSRVAMAVGRGIRDAIFAQVLRFGAREMEHVGVSSLITRTSNDIQQIQIFTLSTLTLVVTAPVMAVGGIVLALSQDIPLALLMAALVPVLGAIVAVLIRRTRPHALALQTQIDALNRVVREQISGVRVIRAFVREGFEQDRFGRVNREAADVSIRLGRVSTLLLPLVVNTVNVFSVLLVWVGGQRISSGDMQIGGLVAFLTYLVMVQGAVLSAAFVVSGLPRTEVSASRAEEVLQIQPSIVSPRTPVRTFRAPGWVELSGVSFRYPGAEADVLRRVDLVAGPGSTTAIVGSMGSGKTTLIRLICRLHDPTTGQVRVGGEDVTTLDRSLLAGAIGLVPQEPHLFAGTIGDNLRYGRPDATDGELWHALEAAQANSFVAALDGQLDAAIAPRAANLSGGERQRLAIARALVRRPAIYLLDDYSSALDYATEAAVRRELARETADATVIVVSQRMNTIRGADQIVVLDGGGVDDVGTHAELLQRSRVYREIVHSQSEEQVR